jgi:hypothetical protein
MLAGTTDSPTQDSRMTSSLDETSTLADRIIDRLEELIIEAERLTKPLELDPYRGQLFELFVTAEGAGYLRSGHEPDLSADGLCRLLGARWGLASAAKEAMTQQTRMPQEHLSKMRLLWSVMRMWMEWDYAWQRWPEFHTEQTGDPLQFPDANGDGNDASRGRE